ncbi:MAG: class I SAM-dependent methyltransferase [Phycisphaerales bacterium]|nr:class I SAM-dependent methyltransferase [Phycisphaerales bacterium]
MSTALQRFEGTRQALAAARERIYHSGHVEGEDGSTLRAWPVGLTRERGEALGLLARRERAMRCVETGFAFGMSASFLLEAVIDTLATCSADAAPPLLTSIDPFAQIAWKNAGVRHLRAAGAEHLHRLIVEPSEIVLPRLLSAGERFDLAFVDGDHRFEHVMIDIFYARRLVGPGRLIIVDDAWMPSVQKACAFFTSAGLCAAEHGDEHPAMSKFVRLRVTAEGDQREWDHFAPF